MSLPTGYFDAMYAEHPDPWGFTDRAYEARKRAVTLASLPDEHYGLVYEPGCSIGVLTEALAGRAGRLLATDVSQVAVEAARRRLQDRPGVSIERAGLLAGWPGEEVDLVVVSEVGYYFAGADLDAVAAGVARAATIAAVHWRHPVRDYPTSGDEVHRRLGSAASAAGHVRLVEHVEEDFRLEVWSRDGRSVARRTGLKS